MSAVFAATLGTLIARGAFGTKVLQRGPKREVGFDVRDLMGAMASYLVGAMLASLVVLAWRGGSEVDLEAMPDKELALFTIVAQTVMWAPAVLYLIIRLQRGGNLRLGGLIPRRPLRDLGVAAVGIFVAYILAWGLGTALLIIIDLMGTPPPESGHVILEKMAASDSRLLIVLLTLSAVIIAPIAEEFFFRGLLQTTLQSIIGYDKRWTSILPVAVFFGAIHYGSVPWQMLPVLVLLGVVFGWVYERTGSLWCAVAVHAGFNATNILLSLVA